MCVCVCALCTCIRFLDVFLRADICWTNKHYAVLGEVCSTFIKHIDSLLLPMRCFVLLLVLQRVPFHRYFLPVASRLVLPADQYFRYGCNLC